MDDNFASGAREEATGISNLEVSFESLKLQGIFSQLHPISIVF